MSQLAYGINLTLFWYESATNSASLSSCYVILPCSNLYRTSRITRDICVDCLPSSAGSSGSC